MPQTLQTQRDNYIAYLNEEGSSLKAKSLVMLLAEINRLTRILSEQK